MKYFYNGMKYLFYLSVYFLFLFLLGAGTGYWWKMFSYDYDPVADRNAFVENCVQKGKSKEMCIDKFYGFPIAPTLSEY